MSGAIGAYSRSFHIRVFMCLSVCIGGDGFTILYMYNNSKHTSMVLYSILWVTIFTSYLVYLMIVFYIFRPQQIPTVQQWSEPYQEVEKMTQWNLEWCVLFSKLRTRNQSQFLPSKLNLNHMWWIKHLDSIIQNKASLRNQSGFRHYIHYQVIYACSYACIWCNSTGDHYIFDRGPKYTGRDEF